MDGNGNSGISFSVSKDAEGNVYVTTAITAGLVSQVFSVPTGNAREYIRLFTEMLENAEREQSGLAVVVKPTSIVDREGKPIRSVR